MSHPLLHKWTLWFHYKKDTCWDMSSYQNLCSVEDLVPFCQLLKLGFEFDRGAFFMMRDSILPIWEDDRNRGGTIWSFRVSAAHVPQVWQELCIRVIGETLTTHSCINGMSVHPKQQCYLIKIWLSRDSPTLTFRPPAIPNLSIADGRVKKPY